MVIHKTQNSLFFLVYVPAAAKPVYSTNTTYNATPRVVAQPKVQAQAQASSAATYVYPTAVTTQQPASSYSTTYAGGSNATTTVSYTSKGKAVNKDFNYILYGLKLRKS